jgi:hypothetical protein
VLHHEREARSAARELTERYEEINLLYFISEILGLRAVRAGRGDADPDGGRRRARRAARVALGVHPEDRRLHLAAPSARTA